MCAHPGTSCRVRPHFPVASVAPPRLVLWRHRYSPCDALLTSIRLYRCCFHIFIYSLCGACIFVVLVGITAAGVVAEEAGQRQTMNG